MRICLLVEGSYPYVVGGVSSWIHSLIQSFPGHEFVILAIVADRSLRGEFAYDLPDNVDEVYEVYLNRPFVYALVDTSTGVPLFTGVVRSISR